MVGGAPLGFCWRILLNSCYRRLGGRSGGCRREIGGGLGWWIGTIAAAATSADRYESVAGLRAEIDAAGRSPSVAEVMATRGWQHEAQAARVAASVTGGVGAVLVLTGLGLIVSDRRGAPRGGGAPRVGPAGYGLGPRGPF